MKEIKNDDRANVLRGAGKGKDRQKRVVVRLSKIELRKKTK